MQLKIFTSIELKLRNQLSCFYMPTLGIKRTVNIIMPKIIRPQTCKYLALGCLHTAQLWVLSSQASRKNIVFTSLMGTSLNAGMASSW